MLDSAIILYPNYIHQDFKDEFTNRLLESIGYISEFVETEKPSSLNINWKICAAHYLAIKRAENQDLNSVREYISYIKSQSHNPTQQIKILPMVSHDSSFEKDMIFEILQDDPTAGIGFFNDAHVNNNEALKIEQALHFIKLNNIDFYNEIIKYIDTIYLTGSSADGSRVMRSGTNFYM